MTVGAELHDAIGELPGAAQLIGVREHPLRSSCRLRRLDLLTVDGRLRSVIFKDLSPAARHRAPRSVLDPRREIEVYRMLRERPEISTPRLLGFRNDEHRRRFWLFVEAVEGEPLWQSAHARDWVAAATWLARFHRLRPPASKNWLRYDRRFYAGWLRRASRLAPAAGLDELSAAHRRAVGLLAATPVVFIHGDFYPANVLVTRGRAPGVCVVDFELAGLGAAVIDLAALLTGLPSRLASRMIDAYRDAAPATAPAEQFELLLVSARLHLAVRWLGWLARWEPPTHQAFDWALEARTAAAQLS